MAGTREPRPRFAEAWLVAVLDSLSEGVIALDGDGRMTAANPAAEALLGFDVALRRHEHWTTLGLADLHDTGGRRLERHPIEHALQAREPTDGTVVATDASGQRWLELATHILDPVAGAGSGVVVSFRDVTDRVEAERDRERALRVLRDVLAMSSHDLRQPIAVIRGYARLLLDDEASEPDRASLEVIARQTDHLMRLVADLSLTARLEAGRLEVNPTTTELDSVLADARRGTVDRVEVDVPSGLRMRVDPDHARRILANLLENAGKYGRPPISVAATLVGRTVRIAVTDAGPGVPEEFVPVLFERFTRAGGRPVDGSGMGLAIVADLARLNGGSAHYERVHPHGSRFVIELPADPASAEAPPATR